MAKTIITFRFVAPYGFSLDGKGNFYPRFKQVEARTPGSGVDLTRLPNYAGNIWVTGYDFDDLYTLTLEDEEPREIPEYIAAIEDEATRAAFKVEGAKEAASHHASNNHHRDELRRMAGLGKIEIVSDSFMDKRMPTKPKLPMIQPEKPDGAGK